MARGGGSGGASQGRAIEFQLWSAAVEGSAG